MSTSRSVTIYLREIRAWGRHGADPGEAEIPQPFDVDVCVMADVGAACDSDDLRDTIDYATLQRRIVDTIRHERCRLLERLADRLIDAVMDDARVYHAAVRLAKPRLLAGATPSVRVSRDREREPAADGT